MLDNAWCNFKTAGVEYNNVQTYVFTLMVLFIKFGSDLIKHKIRTKTNVK